MSALTLHLLRHAKSSWKQADLDDHERPLNRRGREACGVMGRHLARAPAPPEMVLCSDARRARETWQLVSRELAADPPLRLDPGLYLCTAGEMLARVQSLPEGVRSVLVVAHQPGIEQLARGLAGRGDRRALGRMAAKFPTAGLATLAFDVAGWPDVAPERGRLEGFVTPREIAGEPG